MDNKALSIVKINDDYSIALVSVANGSQLHSIPSYFKLIDQKILDIMSQFREEEIDLYVVFDKKLSSGPDLFLCLKEAMEKLKEETSNMIKEEFS